MMNERLEFERKGNRLEQKLLQQRVGLLNRQHGITIPQGQEDQGDHFYDYASSLAAAAAPLTITAGAGAAASAMKDPATRTKVVVRHLPPSLSEAAFLQQIESRFAGLYDWISFYPGKSSHKFHIYSRAYIDFKRSEDVLEFYEVFDGHIFVIEKGTQYKALVEYAPYQRVPKPCPKKDVREGTIFKDPEYLDFLGQLEKPVEYLPSAEVQLERREAERASVLATNGAKDAVIVTPLMEFVRQKRASKATPQRPLSISGKPGSRGGGSATLTSGNIVSKRVVDRSRMGSIYLPSPVTGRLKEKSAYIPRREDRQRRDRDLVIERRKKDNFEVKEKKLVREAGSPRILLTNSLPDMPDEFSEISLKDSQDVISDPVVLPVSANEIEHHGSRGAVSGKVSSDITEVTSDVAKDVSGREGTKKKQLSVKEKDREKELILNGAMAAGSLFTGSIVSGNVSPRIRSPTSTKLVSGSQPLLAQQQGATLPGRGASVASGYKQSQRREAGGRFNRVASSLMSPQQLAPQALSQSDNYIEKDKRPPRPQNPKAGASIPSHEAETGILQNDIFTRFSADEKSSRVSTHDSFTYGAVSERQEGRRVRNKDRPDRPVWTVRRRAEAIPGAESDVSFSNELDKHQTQYGGKSSIDGTELEFQADSSQQLDVDAGQGSSGVSYSFSGKTRCTDSTSRVSRGSRNQEYTSFQGDVRNELMLLSRSSEVKIQGTSRCASLGNENGDNSVQMSFSAAKERRKLESQAFWNEIEGNHRLARRDRNPHGTKDVEASLSESSKHSKRSGGPSAYGGHEKQVWVAKSGSGS